MIQSNAKINFVVGLQKLSSPGGGIFQDAFILWSALFTWQTQAWKLNPWNKMNDVFGLSWIGCLHAMI